MKSENALSTQLIVNSQTIDYAILGNSRAIAYPRLVNSQASDCAKFYGEELISENVKNSKPCQIYDIEANKASISSNPSFSEFDKLLSSLEEDEEIAKKLSEARKWVGNHFYSDNLTMASLRLSAGLSQHNLGKTCGIEQSHVSRYESGKHEPSLSLSVKLAKALNVDVETLFMAWDNSRKITQSGANHD